MYITDMLRRPLAKVAVAAAAAAALAGGLYGAQAASAGSSDEKETERVVLRAAEPKADGHGSQIVPRATPGIDEQPAPPPAE